MNFRFLLVLIVLGMAFPATAVSSRVKVLKHVPATTEALFAVDQTRLSKHPDYNHLVQLLEARGWVPKLIMRRGCGLVPGRQVHTTVTFRLPKRRSGVLLIGRPNLQAARKCAKAKLGKKFKLRRVGAAQTFTVSTHYVVAKLAPGVVALGTPDAVGKAIAATQARAKGLLGSRAFKTRLQEAADNHAVIWSVIKVPRRIQRRLATKPHGAGLAFTDWMTLSVRGKKGMTLRVTGHARAGKGAKLRAAAQASLTRRPTLTTLLRLIGIKVAFSGTGDRGVATIRLSPTQVRLFARYGHKVLRALE